MRLLRLCPNINDRVVVFVNNHTQRHGLTADLTIFDVFLSWDGPVHSDFQFLAAIRTVDDVGIHGV